jgi:hypothetical protein
METRIVLIKKIQQSKKWEKVQKIKIVRQNRLIDRRMQLTERQYWLSRRLLRCRPPRAVEEKVSAKGEGAQWLTSTIVHERGDVEMPRSASRDQVEVWWPASPDEVPWIRELLVFFMELGSEVSSLDCIVGRGWETEEGKSIWEKKIWFGRLHCGLASKQQKKKNLFGRLHRGLASKQRKKKNRFGRQRPLPIQATSISLSALLGHYWFLENPSDKSRKPLGFLLSFPKFQKSKFSPVFDQFCSYLWFLQNWSGPISYLS